MEAVNLANSSTTSKRRELDFYPTPPEATRALMMFLQTEGLLEGINTVWEPACGDGAMSRVVEQYAPVVVSSDIRDTGYGAGGRDFMLWTEQADAIITNPPFKQSADFIKKALADAPLVAMLLKSQYWHASKRTSLFAAHPPSYVLPLNWRPDFMAGERGGAPTMEVLWTVWIRGQGDTRYRILSKPQ